MTLNTEPLPHGYQTMTIPVNLSTGALSGAARVATFANARRRSIRIVSARRADVSDPLAGGLGTVARGSPLHQIAIQKQYRIAELFDPTLTQVGRSPSPNTTSTRGTPIDFSLDAPAGPTTTTSRTYSWRRKVFPS